MTPFEEALYRLIQDSKLENTAFTTESQDRGNEISKIVEFAKHWDYKQKYESLEQTHNQFKEKHERDIKRAAALAGLGICKELIPIFDEVYALLNLSEKDTPHHKILSLIVENFEKLLERRHGDVIKPIKGDLLDPQLHRAVEAETSPNHLGNTVVEVFRYGYSVFGKIIREAEVKVLCGLRETQKA